MKRLLRVGALTLVIGGMTGCDGCNKKPDVPMTEQSVQPSGSLLAARATAGAWCL